MYYVYSLSCKEDYYVGCTDDLAKRILRHKKGYVPATKNRLPVALEFYVAIKDKNIAFSFERYLKGPSGRAFVRKHLSL